MMDVETMVLSMTDQSRRDGELRRIGAVAGIAGSVPVGLVQAYTGESIALTRIATIIFPTIITLWVAE